MQYANLYVKINTLSAVFTTGSVIVEMHKYVAKILHKKRKKYSF